MVNDELKKVVGDKGCYSCSCSGEGEFDDTEVYIDDPHYQSREEAVDGLRKVIDEMWSVYYKHGDVSYLDSIAKCESTILENLP
jgi:hypothetical protein